MWGEVVVTEGPDGQPLQVAELVRHCNASGDLDALTDLGDYLSAAVDQVQAITGTRLVTQTVSVSADNWRDFEALPVAPIQSIEDIEYIDGHGEEQTLAPEVYEARLDGLAPTIVRRHGKTWPATLPGSRIKLTAIVGYGEPGAQPPAVLHAIKLMVGDAFQHRENTQVGSIAGTIPSSMAVDSLLQNHRRALA